MYEIEETTFSDTDLFYFSSIIFKKITLLLKNQLFRYSEDSFRLVFIDEECGNLIVVNDGGELTRSFSKKKKSDVLQ